MIEIATRACLVEHIGVMGLFMDNSEGVLLYAMVQHVTDCYPRHRQWIGRRSEMTHNIIQYAARHVSKEVLWWSQSNHGAGQAKHRN